MADCWLGLDLGGSHTSVVALDAEGHVVHRATELLDRRWAQATIISRMLAQLQSAIAHVGADGYRTDAIGVGLPGVVDMATGTALLLPNLAGQWRGVPLRAELEEALDTPVSIVNDVRAFTLAEHAYGAGRGARHMLGIAIGTGIGGGLILDGRAYFGHEGRAGELGHQTVDPFGLPCGCGSHGCLETIASGPAVAAAAARAIAQGFPTVMGELVDHDLNRLNAAVVGSAAAQGDATAQQILQRVGFYLGIALANLVTVLNPERIVVGGGVAQAGEPLFAAVRETIAVRCRTVTVDRVQVVPATLGTDAGVIGAAVWARVRPAGI